MNNNPCKQKIWKQFADEAVTFLRRELDSIGSPSDNVAFLEKYRDDKLIDKEVIRFIEITIMTSVLYEEDMSILLEIFTSKNPNTIEPALLRMMNAPM